MQPRINASLLGAAAAENPALRQSLGMLPDQKGVLIKRVEPTSHATGRILPGDVVTRFDGVAVSNDGTVPFRTGERIAFAYLVSQKASPSPPCLPAPHWCFSE